MNAYIRAIVLVGATVAGGAACSTARASAPIERPPLEVPPPPPRVILPLPPPDVTYLEPVAELPPAPGAPTAARPRPPSKEKPEPPRPDPKTEAPPTPPANQTPPVPQLRTAESANSDQLRGQIQEILTRTRAILDKVDPGTLKDPRKKAYEDARLFAQQAEEELKVSNFLLAREFAEKAEKLAKDFQGR